MKFEDLQNQWQKEGGDAPLQVSYDMFLKEVRRNQYTFDREILWRDIQEAVASLFGVACLFFFGIALNRWFYAAAAGMFYLVVFIIVYRQYRPRKSPPGAASLKICAEESLREIHCQMQLLNTVFWWYLLPPGITFLFPIVHVGCSMIYEGNVFGGILLLGGFAVGAVLVCLWVCRLNWTCVKNDLAPRKQELEELLHTIGNGSEVKSSAGTVPLQKISLISILITLLLSALLFLFIPKTSWVENMMSEDDEQAAIEITPPLLPDETIAPKELKILSARYGAEDQWVDVTQKVADAVHGNTLSIHSGNELAGKDPKFLAGKTLEIKCLWDGQEKTIRVQEGVDLKIPFKADTPVPAAPLE